MSSPGALIAGEPRATPAAPSLVWKPEPIVARASLAELYARAQPFEVEAGSGDGSFLIQYAKAHPERNFLGIERLLGRLRKTDRKGLRAGLTNLRVLRLEAAYSVEFLLPPAAASAVHVYFPDPWPKRRHRQRRLVNEAFVASVVRALQPGGHLYLRTDDADYYAQMIEVCAACRDLAPAETPRRTGGLHHRLRTAFSGRGPDDPPLGVYAKGQRKRLIAWPDRVDFVFLSRWLRRI